jgi:hypothetical protein
MRYWHRWDCEYMIRHYEEWAKRCIHQYHNLERAGMYILKLKLFRMQAPERFHKRIDLMIRNLEVELVSCNVHYPSDDMSEWLTHIGSKVHQKSYHWSEV